MEGNPPNLEQTVSSLSRVKQGNDVYSGHESHPSLGLSGEGLRYGYRRYFGKGPSVGIVVPPQGYACAGQCSTGIAAGLKLGEDCSTDPTTSSQSCDGVKGMWLGVLGTKGGSVSSQWLAT